jgi:glycine/D-amino acid oxidase-like deaminating enzyme
MSVSLLDSFARGLPIRTGTEVLYLEARDCGYDLVTATGRMAARAVVVASGGQRRPVIPVLASALPAGLTPADTIVGGRAVHDPGGLLASPR